MRSKNVFIASTFVLAIFATLVCNASLFAKGSPKNATTADLLLAPATPPCPELTEVTGIYQDGLNTYQNVEWFQGDLRFTPKCSDGRELITLLPSEAIALLTPGDLNTCGGDTPGFNSFQLKIPALLNAQTGVVGQDPGFDGVKHYFLIDWNGDGNFGNDDTAVNIFWHDGIYLTRTEYANRTVYELTTALTSHYAEVRSGGARIGDFCIPLRLTVTRLK